MLGLVLASPLIMKFGEMIIVMARETHIVTNIFFFFFSFQGGQISHWAATDENEIAAEEEEKLGSKVYALNKSPSSVHSELDASLIIAILTLHTKDRIALNYICCTVHSR